MDNPCIHCTISEKHSFCLRQNKSLFAHANGSDPSDLTDFTPCQEEMKAIFESSADCILVWDKDYNYLYANQAAIDHVGTTRDKVIGKNIREGLGHIPDFMHLWMSRVDEVFRTGQPMRVEDAVQIIDRLVYSQSVLSPIRLPCGQMFAVGIVYRDITRQKELELSLCQSENWFRAIFQGTNVGILVADIESRRFTDANPAICQMLGYTRAELLHLGVTDIHPKEALNDVMKSFTEIMNGTNIAYDLPYLRKDGSIFYARINGALLKANGKELAVGFFSDTTEQKMLQQQLAESEKQYRQLYNNAQVALFRSRVSDGKLLVCNKAAVSLFGFDNEEEFLEHSVIESYINPKDRDNFLEQLKKNGQVRHYPIQLKCRDNTPIWVSFTARAFFQLDYIEGIMYDITASKVLTDAEKNVLDLVMQGKSTKEIAKILNRSRRTIEDHRAHIMQKLNAENLVDLVQKAHFFHSESLQDKP